MKKSKTIGERLRASREDDDDFTPPLIKGLDRRWRRPWKCRCGSSGTLGNCPDGFMPPHVRPDKRQCKIEEEKKDVSKKEGR